LSQYKRILLGHEAAIRAEVERQPDATLEELAERVAKSKRMRVRVSAPTMCRELQRIGLPGKRSRSTPTRGIHLMEYKKQLRKEKLREHKRKRTLPTRHRNVLSLNNAGAFSMTLFEFSPCGTRQSK
jgi:hypothetical protein